MEQILWDVVKIFFGAIGTIVLMSFFTSRWKTNVDISLGKIKELSTRLHDTREELGILKETVQIHYVHKDEFNKVIDKFEKSIDKFEVKLRSPLYLKNRILFFELGLALSSSF